MTAMIEVAHIPLRPSFDCASCGEPWPCPPAKVELAEQYHGDALSLSRCLGAHMTDAMEYATANPGWGQVDNLYDRFLGWIPRSKGDRRAA